MAKQAKAAAKRAKPNTAPGHGSVRLLKRGRMWYARFRVAGHRHEVSLKVTNKKVAERKSALLDGALEKGEPWEWVVGRTKTGERSFAEVVEEFLKSGARWSPSTRKGNTALVKQLTAEFGATPVTKLKQADIEGYLARRRDEDGISKGTSNRYLCALKVILGKAHEWGYVPSNVAANLKTQREGHKQPMPFTREEETCLLCALEPQDRRVAEVYLQTGLRRGELMKLQWADVNFEERTLTVRAPKNDDDRTIPMSQRVLAILQEIKREARSGVIVPLAVFGPAADIWHALRRIADDVLQPGRRHRLQHRLRDTAATTMLDAGVALDRVQTILGHRNIQMTRRYAETRPEGLRQAIAAAFDG